MTDGMRQRTWCRWLGLVTMACALTVACSAPDDAATPASALDRTLYPIVEAERLGARLVFVEVFGVIPGGVQDGCRGLGADDVATYLDYLGRGPVIYNFNRNGEPFEVYVRPPVGENTPASINGPGGTFRSADDQATVAAATRFVGREEWVTWARTGERRQRLVGCSIEGDVGWDAVSMTNSGTVGVTAFYKGRALMHGIDDRHFQITDDPVEGILAVSMGLNQPVSLDHIEHPGVQLDKLGSARVGDHGELAVYRLIGDPSAVRARDGAVSVLR